MYIQEFQVEFHTLIALEDLYVCEELQENILLDSINSNILHFENLTSGEVYREYISFPGEYRAMSDAGCVLETINLINKCPFNLYIPNTITPNNDGINDDFEIFSTGLKDIEIIVFNRWGEKVEIQKKAFSSWGFENISQGVYTWIMSFEISTEENKSLRRYKNGVLNVIK